VVVEIDDAAKGLRDLPESTVRRPGFAKGAFVVSDDFDAPLPDDEMESWS
jgi:hypothetical protein